MAAPLLNDLVAQLEAYRLLSADQLAVVIGDLVHRFPDSANLVRDLVQRGWLTPHQANRLMQGRGNELVTRQEQVREVTAAPDLLDSGARWRLGLILGGVFLVIFVIAMIARPKSNPKDDPPDPDTKGTTPGKSAAWPEDLDPLPGRTKASRGSDETFVGTNNRAGSSVEVRGQIVFEEVTNIKISVRQQGKGRRDYDDLEDVPFAQKEIARTLRELGRRRVFGEWGK